MNPQVIFWCTLFVLVSAVVYLDLKHGLLRDLSSANYKPYSYARVQLAWWSVIVLAAFISIIFSKGIPTLDQSTLILLGISSATTAAARVGDASDISRGLSRSQDQKSESFLIDILSDANGVNIQRFQALAFNVTFGIWFICQVAYFLPISTDPNGIIPQIDSNNLILLGLSSGTYAVMKTTENRSSQKQLHIQEQAELVADEAIGKDAKGQG